MEKVKDKIKQLRISKNLTQQQLADKMHVTKQAISKWEKGKSIPDIASIELLSDFFGVSVDYFVNNNIEMQNKGDTMNTSPKAVNKPNVAIITLIALLVVAVIALSAVVGVLLSKNKPTNTTTINGFKITYLKEETLNINNDDKTLILNFNIYNSTDHAKTCSKENFSLDNNSLYIEYISPDQHSFEPQEEIKVQVLICTKDLKTFGSLSQKSVTIKYAGQDIAKIEW